MKKVLILTAAFSDGHNTAARNLASALEASDEASVEVVDLFENSLGVVNSIVKTTCLGLARYAPRLWKGVHSLLDNSEPIETRLLSSGNLRKALEEILQRCQPDCVLSTHPIYSHLFQELYGDHGQRPFKLITVVTDSVSINPSWQSAPSDWFCVTSDDAASALAAQGVPPDKIKAFGYPVSPVFAEPGREPLGEPFDGGPVRVLCIIDTSSKKHAKALDRLLEMPNVHITITVARDVELKQKLAKLARKRADRVRVIGWTNQMPALMLSHHLVISRADRGNVHEAIAARCPMILNQIIPGVDEDSARLVQQNDIGVVALKARKVVEWVAKTFADDHRIWRSWRENLARLSNPAASARIAQLALSQCDGARRTEEHFETHDAARNGNPLNGGRAPSDSGPTPAPSMLLCDFHIHTNYSDGKLTAPKVVDFYGQRGFDCICITDHLGDPRRLTGKFSELASLTLPPEQLDEYFQVLAQERRRAWRKYKMIVMAGLEFNKDGSTKKTSAHLLGIDLKGPIDAALDLPEIIKEIHAQGGLAIASHPHLKKSEWGKNTLYLWENQDRFAPLIDAWEIANRNDVFTPPGLKRLAFVANSDFHKPKHIHSWKTLLRCEKGAEAIKKCVRENEHVAITLYRGTDEAEASKGDETGTAREPLTASA